MSAAGIQNLEQQRENSEKAAATTFYDECRRADVDPNDIKDDNRNRIYSEYLSRINKINVDHEKRKSAALETQVRVLRKQLESPSVKPEQIADDLTKPSRYEYADKQALIHFQKANPTATRSQVEAEAKRLHDIVEKRLSSAGVKKPAAKAPEGGGRSASGQGASGALKPPTPVNPKTATKAEWQKYEADFRAYRKAVNESE
jgi:hypothetical protein